MSLVGIRVSRKRIRVFNNLTFIILANFWVGFYNDFLGGAFNWSVKWSKFMLG
jgi:hypothetical protein